MTGSRLQFTRPACRGLVAGAHVVSLSLRFCLHNPPKRALYGADGSSRRNHTLSVDFKTGRSTLGTRLACRRLVAVAHEVSLLPLFMPAQCQGKASLLGKTPLATGTPEPRLPRRRNLQLHHKRREASYRTSSAEDVEASKASAASTASGARAYGAGAAASSEQIVPWAGEVEVPRGAALGAVL
jgi:hypothetical protein